MPFVLNHWIGITWFLGWGVAVWQTIDNWIEKRAKRRADKKRSVAEELAIQDRVGAQVICTAAFYGGGGPYSEYDLRAVLKRAGLDEDRVLPIMWGLEDAGIADRKSVLSASLTDSVTWVIR